MRKTNGASRFLAAFTLASAAAFGVAACSMEDPTSAPVVEQEQAPAPEREAVEPTEPKVPVEEQQAATMAEDYLDSMPFSKEGLVEQLEYEGFPTETAQAAVDSLSTDWSEQAAAMAADYLDTMAFSHDGLVEQLVYEGFTQKQAEYGADSVGL